MKKIIKLKDFVGQYKYYPDLTKKRKAEGGYRISNASDKKRLDKPLVSIVTAVYNAEKTLERTIQSILDQQYRNIEHILIDGGSTDGTLKILEKYRDRLAYYISEPDSGIYSAMNKGISLAEGDYICLVNADDYYSDDFIKNSVEMALKTKAEIVYSQFSVENKKQKTQEINDAIYIHHSNINHCTFMVSKSTYDLIGPYREDYKIVSDVIWARDAYHKGVKFIYLPKCMFFFTEGGTSSGNSDKRRTMIINEAAESVRETFPFLTHDESKRLYLSRFNIKYIDTLNTLYNRYANKETLFQSALQKYLIFMLSHNYIFQTNDISQLLPQYKELCKKLEIDLSILNIEHSTLDIKNIFSHINTIAKAMEKGDKSTKRLLHFVSSFSTPSETFIYDLIQRMEATEEYTNVILCDKRLLEDIRPYEKCIHIDWESLPLEISELLYEYIFKKIKPNAIIAHFAINGWKLYQRLIPLQIKLPIVHMTHGIDVFSINGNIDYQEYILNDASIDPDTSFTAVSKYLSDELVIRGVPSEKITLVSNVVHERFFENRKCSGFYDGSRKLELLNVGRLIGLKGHRELIEGLNYFVKNVSKNVHLTILYGKSDNDLEVIREQIDNFELNGKVSLIDFIDFTKQPDYYCNFDLYISSSKYSEGDIRRSETFGMSTLEAILAGLPVIVTDAGGSPEVIGDEEIFAKIVPHADGLAIGKAIESCVKDTRCFSDNIHYAKERLKKFNSERQLEQLGKVIESSTSIKTKVALFSSITLGGAGGAATRVHKALRINGINSTLITRNSNVVLNDPSYKFLNAEIGLKWEAIQSNKYKHPGFTIFSLNEPNIRRATLKKLVKDMDIINIQWVARFLTVEDIGYLSRLGKALVITVRDMHPLAGGCHFFHSCEQWKTSCYGCPQLVGDEEHFPAKILAIKKRYWDMNNITFVALSQHTKNIIEQSSLYSNNRIEIIANPIELDIFTPIQKDEARKHFKIEKKSPLLFYVPSYGSLVKGSHEFKEALHYVKKKYPDFELTLIMAGSATVLTEADDFLYPIIHLGSFFDNELLAKAYSSADATIVPSLEETFSNTAAESISCGTPVIGFKTGAIPEIAGNGDRGISVPVGDIEALGEAIYSILNHSDLAQNCRSYAEENFSFKKQGQKYAALFNELKKAPKVTNILNPNDVPLIDPSIIPDLYHWQAKTFKIEKKDIIGKSKQVQNSNQNNCQNINIFKENFKELCQTSTLKSPIQKAQKYKAVVASWYDLKEEQKKQIQGKEDFSEAFKDLRMTSIKRAPIKKFKNYKKLITTWHKHK